VTHTARYEPNDKLMADVNETGRVRMLGMPGEVGIVIRPGPRGGLQPRSAGRG
jgi:hypothetical protein